MVELKRIKTIQLRKNLDGWEQPDDIGYLDRPNAYWYCWDRTTLEVLSLETLGVSRYKASSRETTPEDFYFTAGLGAVLLPSGGSGKCKLHVLTWPLTKECATVVEVEDGQHKSLFSKFGYLARENNFKELFGPNTLPIGLDDGTTARILDLKGQMVYEVDIKEKEEEEEVWSYGTWGNFFIRQEWSDRSIYYGDDPVIPLNRDDAHVGITRYGTPLLTTPEYVEIHQGRGPLGKYLRSRVYFAEGHGPKGMFLSSCLTAWNKVVVIYRAGKGIEAALYDFTS